MTEWDNWVGNIPPSHRDNRRRKYSGDWEQKAISPINSEHIKAFASVFDETQYDVGGTFIFTNGNTIAEEQAKYFIRLFLNLLDKAYFDNKAARKNIRVVNGGAILGHGSDGIVLSRAA